MSQSGFQQLPCSRAIAWLYNTYALLFIQSIFQSPILHIWPCKSKPYSGMSSTKNNQRLCMHKMYHCLQKLALAFYLFLFLLTTSITLFVFDCSCMSFIAQWKIVSIVSFAASVCFELERTKKNATQETQNILTRFHR